LVSLVRSEPDSTIADLDAQARSEIGLVLADRARAELSISGFFAHLTEELIWTGAERKVVELAANAVHQELGHAAIWCDLAGRYLAREVPWPDRPRRPIPRHADANPALLPSLHVIGMCCINETLAIARLEAGIATCVGSAMRSALRTILKDEVDHARLGWAHLASRHVLPEQRSELSRWVPQLLLTNLRAMLHEDAPTLDAYPHHGFIPRAQLIKVMLDATRQVVLPGFEHVGIDVTTARAAVAEAWPWTDSVALNC
jgi:hypothetical protein